MNGKPIVVTAAVIKEDGRYLVARRRPGGPRGGLWEFPGGKVEPGERDDEALRRELREELGIDVSVGQPTDTVHWVYPDLRIELRSYECRIVGGRPDAAEHEELRWVTPHELLELPLSEADVEVARRLATT